MVRSLRPLDVYPITTRTLEVLRVADVTPGMRRITLGGPELAAHVAANGYPVAAFRSDGFDDEGKLILKHPDVDVAVAPEQADGVLNWPRSEHLLIRTYTIRRWDPEAGEVDLDFVRHGVGPATSWAYRVQPGERVQWAGPKMSAPHPVGVDWTLVAGDETALPAIGRWLEEWPAGARGQVFIEVGQPDHRQELRVPEGVEITWLSRDGADPGTTTLLFDAIRNASWWEGTVFAWVAGETLTLTPIRRWLRNEKGLPKEQVEVTGYWRRQEVVVTGDSGVQDLDATEDAGEAFHELSEILPGFAVRVAATIGLAEALGTGPRSAAELATATGTDPAGLGKLLRYLTSIGVVESTGDGAFRLTDLGRELENDYVAEALSLGGARAQRELGGMLALPEAIRTGRGDHARWFGSEWSERVLGDTALLANRVEGDAEMAEYTADALAASPVFAGPGRIAVLGRAAGAIAGALARAQDGLEATVVAAPSELAALQQLHGVQECVGYAPGTLLARLPEPVDAVLLSEALSALPDLDAVHALREAAASLRPGGRVLVFGEVLDPESADEHEYEEDLLDFALTGGGARTHSEHEALFAVAGLGEPERITIGWGNTLYVMTPRG